MVNLKTEEELVIIRESAQILGKAHGEVAKLVKPGVKTQALDKVAEEFIRDHGGVPSFKNYNGFPGSLCISVNEVVVHGFPGKYELREADIISVDCGVYFKGYHSDSAYTYPLEGVSEETLLLLERTYESLFLGIGQARAGNRIGAVQTGEGRVGTPAIGISSRDRELNGITGAEDRVDRYRNLWSRSMQYRN